MSDEWSDPDESAQRRRAAWGLGILALVAAIVVPLMAFLLGTSGGGNDNALPPAPSVPLTTPTSHPDAPSRPAGRTTPARHTHSARTTHASPRPAPHRHSHTHAAPPNVPPTGGRVSCPGGDPCVAPGDIGNVMGALNQFRAAHGRGPADGTITAAAQRCALGSGDGSACPDSYFWEPVTGRDGHEVINKIADGGDGISFLLEPKSFQVGWAYEPSAHTYECALVTG